MFGGCPYAGKPFWANFLKYMFCIPMFGKECIEFFSICFAYECSEKECIEFLAIWK